MNLGADYKEVEVKVQRIITYLNHDWDNDDKWKTHIVNCKWPESKEEQEIIRRTFYKNTYEPHIEDAFSFKNEIEREQYKLFY